jgi:hypothetical protein
MKNKRAHHSNNTSVNLQIKHSCRYFDVYAVSTQT